MDETFLAAVGRLNFRPGDIVHLKSDSRPMEVLSVNPAVLVKWLDSAGMEHRDYFDPVTLELVTRKDSPS